MPLQTSGAISLLDIANEFGGGTPHFISEYYRNGGLVPTNAYNTNIPTSGTIAFSNFYGARQGGFEYRMSEDSWNQSNGVFYSTSGAYNTRFFASYTTPVVQGATFSGQAEIGWISYGGYFIGFAAVRGASYLYGNRTFAFAAAQARGWSSGFLAGSYVNWASATSTGSYSSTGSTRYLYYGYQSTNMAVNVSLRYRTSYGRAYAAQTYILQV